MDKHIDLIRKLYEAFSRFDVGTLASIFSPDVTMVQVGRNALAGEFRGWEELLGHFADIPRNTDCLKMEVVTLLADGTGNVAALNLMTICKQGVEHQFRVVHLFEIKAGQVSAMRSIPEDPYALDAFMVPAQQPSGLSS